MKKFSKREKIGIGFILAIIAIFLIYKIDKGKDGEVVVDTYNQQLIESLKVQSQNDKELEKSNAGATIISDDF